MLQAAGSLYAQLKKASILPGSRITFAGPNNHRPELAGQGADVLRVNFSLLFGVIMGAKNGDFLAGWGSASVQFMPGAGGGRKSRTRCVVTFQFGQGGLWRGCVSLWHAWSTQGPLSRQGCHMVVPPFLFSRHDEHGSRACVHPRCTCHDHFARVRKAQQASSTPRLQSRKEWTFPPRMHVTCAMGYMHAHVACMSVSHLLLVCMCTAKRAS